MSRSQITVRLTRGEVTAMFAEHAPVPLMSGFERLMREIDVYLQCVAIVRGLA